MTERTYSRPAVDLDVLLDALFEAGAEAGTVGTGNPNWIGISIAGATAEEIDAIWERAMRELALSDLAWLDQEEINDIEPLRAKLDTGRNSEPDEQITAETFEGLRRRASNQDDGLI